MIPETVERWKLDGRLLIWHYPDKVKGLKGWHLNADAQACQSLVTLINRMLIAEEEAIFTIPVSAPKHICMGPGHEWKSATELRLCCLKHEVPSSFWQLESHGGGLVKLTLSTEKLLQVRTSLKGLPRWKDDFALGPEVKMWRKKDRERWHRECLWFWTKAE